MQLPIPKEPYWVCETIQRARHQAVVVGGSIRDLLLGRTPHDWDVATSMLPEDVVRLFPRVIPTGIQHGTVTVMVGDEPIEVTTFRSEGDYSDGRRPDYVKLGVTLVEDLSRRDFTINALAYDPVHAQLHDPFGGEQDAQKRYIRAVGNPHTRFHEDGLRTMRAVRFAAVLEFRIDPVTQNAIPDALDTLRRVAIERVRDELFKLLGARRPSLGLMPAYETGILDVILSEIPADTWPEAVGLVDEITAPALTRFGAILLSAPPRAAEKVIARYKFSIADRKRLDVIVKHADTWDARQPTASDARRFLNRVAPEHLVDLYPFWSPNVVALFEAVLGEQPPLSLRDLAVTGQDVIDALGVRGGPQVGRTLQELMNAVLENPALNDRETLLEIIEARRA